MAAVIVHTHARRTTSPHRIVALGDGHHIYITTQLTTTNLLLSTSTPGEGLSLAPPALLSVPTSHPSVHLLTADDVLSPISYFRLLFVMSFDARR